MAENDGMIVVSQVEVRRALSGMPYLPITSPGIVSPQDGHDLIRTLNGLADYLREHAEEMETNARELMALQDERRIVRGYFGVDNAQG